MPDVRLVNRAHTGRNSARLAVPSTRGTPSVKRSVVLLLGVTILLLGLVAPAAAHNVVIDPNGEGETKQLWVGGFDVPGQGGALHTTPIGTLPPSHFNGLPQACEATGDNAAVTFVAPPFGVPGDDTSQHGVQH